VEVETGL